MSLDKLDLSLREFLRYGYGGALLSLIAALLWPKAVGNVVTTLGQVLSGFLVVALGAGLYAFHRAFVNAPILEPLAYWVHRPLQYLWGYRPREGGFTCTRHYLEVTFHVPRRNSINALRVVRDSALFPEVVRRRVHVQNSEVHLLFISATVLIGAAVIIRFTNVVPYLPREPFMKSAALAALILLVFGVAASIEVCRQICAEICRLPAQDLQRLLIESQLAPALETPMVEEPANNTLNRSGDSSSLK